MRVRRYSLRILVESLPFYYRNHSIVVCLVDQVNKMTAPRPAFNVILTISNVKTHSTLLR